MIKDILTISKFTIIQINKSKVLVNVIFLSVFIALISYVLSEFTHGAPSKIALDVGFGLASLSSVGISIFLGVTLLSQEIESRTIYMIVSRPVNRFSFYVGKMLGMSMFLVLNTFLVCFVSIVVYLKLGGEFSNTFIIAFLSILIESVMTLFLVIFFSFIVNNVISVITTVALYVIGHGIEDAKAISFVLNRPWLEQALKAYAQIMPNFSRINLKRYVLYSRDLFPEAWSASLLYGLIYILFLGIVSMLVFQNKNLD